MASRRVGGLVAGVAGLIACRNETAPPAPREITFAVTIHAPADMEVFADGKKIGDTTSATGQLQVSIKAATERPSITAKARLPCGSREIQLAESWYKRPFFGEGQNGPYSIPGELRLVARLQRDVFFVDNRGAAATTLRIGELHYAVASERVSRVQTLAPDCEAGAQLSIGDRSFETLRPVPSDTPGYERRIFLVDPTGKRCYELQTIRYNKYPNIGSAPPPPVRFTQQTLHPLSVEPTDLFEKAPDSIVGYQMGARNQLLEIPCK